MPTYKKIHTKHDQPRKTQLKYRNPHIYRCFRETYGNEKTDLNGYKDDTKESSHTSDKIELIDLENQNGGVNVDQRNHGVDDDRCKNRVWCVFEKRSEEEKRQEDNDGHNDVGDRSVTSGHEVNGGS